MEHDVHTYKVIVVRRCRTPYELGIVFPILHPLAITSVITYCRSMLLRCPRMRGNINNASSIAQSSKKRKIDCIRLYHLSRNPKLPIQNYNTATKARRFHVSPMQKSIITKVQTPPLNPPPNRTPIKESAWADKTS